MQKIHFLNKTQDYSITSPMQFPILRLFILKDDIVRLNTIKFFHHSRKQQVLKPDNTAKKNLNLYKKRIIAAGEASKTII